MGVHQARSRVAAATEQEAHPVPEPKLSSIKPTQPTSVQNGLRLEPKGLRLAQTGLFVGLLYVTISVYWGLGGTALLNTVSGSLERMARAGNLGVVLALGGAIVLKALAAVLPLLTVYRRSGPQAQRTVRTLAWIAAAILVVYGLVLTTVGLLVQANVIRASATADHRALAWHAYLWDPWFLVWGMLIAAALLRSRHSSPVH